MASITLRNVIKRYGAGALATQVIHGVNAEIHDGEFVVIVGPSGCGKSTLLRMVAGLEEISEGNILIGDKIVNDLEPAERDIAMVFQNYALYPHMSVFDNMAYGLKIARMPRAKIQQRVQKVAAILELEHLLDRKPRALSGGQRQRVAMGRAIVREPKVFLFDEPLSNLDAKLRVQTRLEIQKLHRELNITSLFVTHDQVEAMTLAQRMIVMNGGNVDQFATPEEVYARPATTFVANFIGSPPMNLLRGKVEGELFVTGGNALALPSGQLVSTPEDVIMGVRPEHISLTEKEGWPMIVDMVEVLGAERLVYGKLGGQLLVIRIDASLPCPDIGATAYLQAKPGSFHWFNAQDGKRLADIDHAIPV